MPLGVAQAGPGRVRTGHDDHDGGVGPGGQDFADRELTARLADGLGDRRQARLLRDPGPLVAGRVRDETGLGVMSECSATSFRRSAVSQSILALPALQVADSVAFRRASPAQTLTRQPHCSAISTGATLRVT